MNRDELRQLLQAKPFEPFHIGMSDGSRHLVAHPESLLLGRHTAMVWQPLGEESDSFVRLSYLHISRIEESAEKRTLN